MGHQRLRATERGRQLTDPGRLDEACSGLEAARQIEGQQSTRQLHLLRRQRVLRVRLEAGVAHLGDPVVALEHPRQPLGGRSLLTQPHPEGAQPP